MYAAKWIYISMLHRLAGSGLGRNLDKRVYKCTGAEDLNFDLSG